MNESEVDLAVFFHFFARGSHIFHDGSGVGAFIKLHDHLLGHEVDGGFLHALGLLRGVLHLVGAVGAVHFDPVGLLHGNVLLCIQQLNNRLIDIRIIAPARTAVNRGRKELSIPGKSTLAKIKHDIYEKKAAFILLCRRVLPFLP